MGELTKIIGDRQEVPCHVVSAFKLVLPVENSWRLQVVEPMVGPVVRKLRSSLDTFHGGWCVKTSPGWWFETFVDLLGGGFKYLLFSSLPVEMIQFWPIFFKWIGSTTNYSHPWSTSFFKPWSGFGRHLFRPPPKKRPHKWVLWRGHDLKNLGVCGGFKYFRIGEMIQFALCIF